MKANSSLLINMPRALELISFFFLGHGPTYPISDISGSTITRGTVYVNKSFSEKCECNCTARVYFTRFVSGSCFCLLQWAKTCLCGDIEGQTNKNC